MSQSLRTLSQKSTIALTTETNLERGRIFTFTAGTSTALIPYPGCFCWNAPTNGTVVVEIWGAAGSSGSSCCCGYGLPGNPGAYARKCFTVTSSCYITGCIGVACRNLSTFRGCSCNTALCWFGSGTAGCMCAQGGAGGRTICHSSNSIFCCFVSGGACNTVVGTGCGFICNHCSGGLIACAFGGDINCCGAISCVYFGHCNSCCICCHTHYVKTSPGTFGCLGSTLAFNVDFNTYGVGSSGIAHQPMASALNSISRTPGTLPYASCWSGQSACACYQAYGCTTFWGLGVPGGPTGPGVQSVIDYGNTGSGGVVRIQFIAS